MIWRALPSAARLLGAHHFYARKAINNYNITNNVTNNTNIKAQVVNVYQQEEDSPFRGIGGILSAYIGNDLDITIPEGILEIAKGAFEDMKYIRKVTFPKSLKKIDGFAFTHCESLETIELGDDVTLDRYAFSHCTGIRTIVLGKNATLADGAFDDCPNLTSFTAGDGCMFVHPDNIYTKEGIIQTSAPLKRLSLGSFEGECIGYPTKEIEFLEIKDGATAANTNTEQWQHLGLRIFGGLKIKNVTIGNNVTLKSPLFSECEIENVSIGSNVTQYLPMFSKCAVQKIQIGANFQCGTYPLCIGAADLPTAELSVTAEDASGLDRESAKIPKRKYNKAPFNAKNVLRKQVLIGREAAKKIRVTVQKGLLERCVCCGGKKFATKKGQTFCKKCKTVYVFENSNN